MRTSFAVLALLIFVFPAATDRASAQLFVSFGKQPVCTQQYQPVCAVKDGMRRTYSNACFARADGARIISRGPCRRR